MTIKLCKPFITGNELKYMADIIRNGKTMCGDGEYTKKVQRLLEERYGVKKALLTTSATAALEFAVRLSNLKADDEVIVPSFTFSSTANAVLSISGVKVVFADITKDTLNIDPNDIARKITTKTKAIIVVHYGGVASDMAAVMKLARKHKLTVIEDAAQCIGARWRGKYLGTIGDFGCISFHETKNITCGEGGALFINRESKRVIAQAEIMREKGTNRTKFLQGTVDKYTWVSHGFSYLPSDLLAAFLLAQLEAESIITASRKWIFNFYQSKLGIPLVLQSAAVPTIPAYADHNAHTFFLVFKTSRDRDRVMRFLNVRGVAATFHYIPLHASPMGKKLGFAARDLPITQHVSKRLLRLPLYAGMKKAEYQYVVQTTIAAIQSLQKQEKKKTLQTRHIPKATDQHTVINA